MSIDEQTVRNIFTGLEHGDGDAFFSHVADDVDWTVMGTHPLAGRYASKQAFKAGTFSKLGKVLPGGAQLNVTHAYVNGDRRAGLRRDGEERHALRQPLLLGRPLRRENDRRGPRLSRFRAGRRTVSPESDIAVARAYLSEKPISRF